MTEQEAAQLREQNAAKDREIAELKAADAKRKAEAAQADNVAFAEAMASEARIPAALPPFAAANKKPLQAQGLTAVCWEVRLRCPDL